MERLVLVDDFDGTVDEGDGARVQKHPLTLGDEVIDTVDLTEANRERLREELRQAIERFKAQARPRTEREAADDRVATKLAAVKHDPGKRVGGKSHLSKKQRAEREQLNAIRVWARKRGHEVSPYGKIPAQVMEAFQEWARKRGDHLTAVTKADDEAPRHLFSNASA